MNARAPQAIQRLWGDISKAIPRAVLSGVVGDAAHSFGYHLARNQLPQSDYSVQLGLDRMGASDCASALDISLPPDLMKTCTRRLLNAAKAGDKRLRGLREFCGTLDGQRTYPWDLHSDGSEGVNSWDDSHLWHIHLSFYRAFADNYDVLAPIADVIAGGSAATDPLEEVMSWYASKEEFERAVAKRVWDEILALPKPAKSAPARTVVGNVHTTVHADLEADQKAVKK